MRLIFLVLIVTLSIGGNSQTIIVNDAITLLEISDVIVTDYPSTKSVKTNHFGKADISTFTKKDTLLLSHANYKSKKICFKDIKDDNFVVYLQDLHTISELKIQTKSKRFDVANHEPPSKMKTFSAKDIKLINAQTTADLLQETGAVLIQKSQAGGGSPIIRGFEANRILLVVDGVRMNNAIYRSGHLQNAITVDNNILDRTDILFGPGSVIYGSDALGGVLHFKTKNPILFGEEGYTKFAANAMARYHTSNNEKTGHFDFSLGGKKWGYLASATASDFGDLKMGENRTHGYQDFGKVNTLVKQFGNRDSIVDNDDPNLHVGSGYRQYDFLQKVRFKASKNLDFVWNTQYSTSTDVPRYDRFNDLSGGITKFSEWYYGPQKRFLTSLKTSFSPNKKFLANGNIIAAYQNLDEDRVNRKLNSDWRNYRFEDVDVFSLNMDFSFNLDSSQSFYYGAEVTHNIVSSTAFSKSITGELTIPNSTRYPDAGSTMSTGAIYASYDNQLSKKLLLKTGIRYSHAVLNAEFKDTNFVLLPFDEIDFTTGALSGSIGIDYSINNRTKLSTNASSGYRSPNVDDFGKVFEKNGYVVVPNNQLKPEHAYTFDLNLSHTAKRKVKTVVSENLNYDLLQFSGGLFYTILKNTIVRTDYQLNNQDSLLYDGDFAKIQTNTNSSQAYIYGATFDVKLRVSPAFSLKSSLTYTTGLDKTNNQPLSHIPPIYGFSGLIFEKAGWYANFYSRYNGWKKAKDFSPNGEDNLDEATIDGSPSWYTLNLKAGYSFKKGIQIQVGAENILDHHYKSFASGISAPGRSFFVTLRTNIN